MNLLIINGSIHGGQKNSGQILNSIHEKLSQEDLSKNVSTEIIHLVDNFDIQRIEKSLLKADAFLFITGTYWDSWGSPLQKFLEISTEWEAKEHFLYKPAAVIVSMHSVGGKEIASRLQGVLNSFGCIIPPFGGIAFSLASQEAIKNNSACAEDFWQSNDIHVLLKNLITCTSGIKNSQLKFTSWPVDREHYADIWWNP